MQTLAGRRVLVTGASSGIGAAACRRLAEAGADVVLVARGREGLERAAAEVRRHGRRAVVAPADVSDRAALAAAFGAGAAALGGLDAVLVNAGVSSYGAFTGTPPEDTDRVVAVTLLGAIDTARTALPYLESSGGTLVFTGSVATRWPLPLMAPYTAAKHGLRGFANALRVELRATRSPVRVAVVHPGPVDTPFWAHVTPVDGRMPPQIPLAYRADTIAAALVEAIVNPRPERVVGVPMRVSVASRALARPVFDRTLALVARWAARRSGPFPPGDALHEPSGVGHTGGGLRKLRRSDR